MNSFDDLEQDIYFLKVAQSRNFILVFFRSMIIYNLAN